MRKVRGLALSQPKGFTLVELLIVVAIIGILAAVVIINLNSARTKSRDARRRADLDQLAKTVELVATNDPSGGFPVTTGALNNAIANPSSDFAVKTKPYMSVIPRDPIDSVPNVYAYFRKDWAGMGCGLIPPDAKRYAFYANLENASDEDRRTLSDNFDICISTADSGPTNYEYNYKVGN